jgi:hypothetical protein
MFNYCPGPVDITAHPRLRHLVLKHKLQIFSNDYKDLSNLTELRSLILNGHSKCTFGLDLYEPIDIKFSCLTRLWIGGSEGGRPYHSWRNVRRLTPDGFIHAVIIANPGLKDISTVTVLPIDLSVCFHSQIVAMVWRTFGYLIRLSELGMTKHTSTPRMISSRLQLART